MPHSLCEDVCGSIENMRWFWGQGPKTIVQVSTTISTTSLWDVGPISVYAVMTIENQTTIHVPAYIWSELVQVCEFMTIFHIISTNGSRIDQYFCSDSEGIIINVPGF